MNNLEEWEKARQAVKEAWGNWKPHFETLTSGSGEKILAFFLLNDTNIEWKLYHDVPAEVSEDFADYMEDAKGKLLEQVGLDIQNEEEKVTDKMAADMTNKLSKCMQEYERTTGLSLPGLVFNMLFYSEWLELPEEILEKRYEEEINGVIQ